MLHQFLFKLNAILYRALIALYNIAFRWESFFLRKEELLYHWCFQACAWWFKKRADEEKEKERYWKGHLMHVLVIIIISLNLSYNKILPSDWLSPATWIIFAVIGQCVWTVLHMHCKRAVALSYFLYYASQAENYFFS